MDLLLCHQRGVSYLIAIDYLQVDSLGIAFHARNGDRLENLVVFLGHGSKIARLSEALEDVPKDKAGRFLGSPGTLMDRIQDLLAPGTVVNTHSQALDKLIRHSLGATSP
jgi:hypothetical protein